MPTKRKKKDEIAIEVTTSRSVTFDLGIPFWDQLVKVAKEIVDRDADGYDGNGHGIPDNADVTLNGNFIEVDWQD